MLKYSGFSGQDRNKNLKAHSAQIIGAFVERIVNDMRRGQLTIAAAAAVVVVITITTTMIFIVLLLLLLLLYRRPVSRISGSIFLVS
jgi:chromate transport protein ChrA